MKKENITVFRIIVAYLSFIAGAGLITGIIVSFGTRQISKVGYRLNANHYAISLHNLFGLTVVMIFGGGSSL